MKKRKKKKKKVQRQIAAKIDCFSGWGWRGRGSEPKVAFTVTEMSTCNPDETSEVGSIPQLCCQHWPVQPHSHRASHQPQSQPNLSSLLPREPSRPFFDQQFFPPMQSLPPLAMCFPVLFQVQLPLCPAPLHTVCTSNLRRLSSHRGRPSLPFQCKLGHFCLDWRSRCVEDVFQRGDQQFVSSWCLETCSSVRPLAIS